MKKHKSTQVLNTNINASYTIIWQKEQQKNTRYEMRNKALSRPEKEHRTNALRKTLHNIVIVFFIIIVFVMAISLLMETEGLGDGFPAKESSGQVTGQVYIKPYYMDSPDPSPQPNKDQGCFIWQEDSGTNSFWHLGIVNEDEKTELQIQGTIRAIGEEPRFTTIRVENIENDTVKLNNAEESELSLDLVIKERDRYDKILFLYNGRSLEFNLTINKEYNPDEFFIGKERTNAEKKRPFSIDMKHRYIITKVHTLAEETVGKDLSQPIEIEVQDEMGNTAPEGINVHCEVDQASGNTLSLDETIDSTGKAYIRFRLEEKPGENRVSLRIYDNEDPWKLTIEGLPDEPDRLMNRSPYLLHGILGKTLAEPLSVVLVDTYGNSLPGEDILFQVVDNGLLRMIATSGNDNTSDENWLTSITVTTDEDGISSVRFILNQTERRNRVRASLAGSPSESPFSVIFTIKGSGDLDNDSIPDDTDEDIDGDDVPNAVDAFPYNPEASIDEDRDGNPEQWNPGYNPTPTETNLSMDRDSDGDGFSDDDEVERGWDPFEYSRYRGRPYIYDMSLNPDPDVEGITEYERMRVTLIIIDGGNISSIDIFYKTFTTNYKGDNFSEGSNYKKVFTLNMKVPKNANRAIVDEKGLQLTVIDGDVMEDFLGNYDPNPLPNKHQSDDTVTVGRVMNWTYEFDYYSTGEKVDFYFVLSYLGEDDTEYQLRFPDEDDSPNALSFRVSSSANIVNGTLEDFCYLFIPVLIVGSIASRRLKKKLATVRFRDIRWHDVHVKEVFFTVKKLFTDISEVKSVLKKGTGKLIRLVYFLGVTGLLLLALELFLDPKNFLLISAVYIGFTLFIAIATPVLYVYFSRWKYKSPTVGKLRLVFLLVFPFAIGNAISSQQYDLAYTLVFVFLFFIPLAMYANLIGSNWNFLLFNSHREFRHGFDYLTNARVGIGERVAAFFFFLSILFMPIIAINNLHGAYEGSYNDGGVIGKYTVEGIQQLGTAAFIQIAARFVGIIIVLNVVILGVAMVFRVVQLQFYSSQKFSGRFGLGYTNYHNLKDDAKEQRRLIAFCFFVFFGYSVLLLLLTIYSNFAYLLPVLPYLSRDILDLISYRLSLAHNIAFLLFWLFSVSKLKTVWRLKGYFDGFVIKVK